MENNSIDTIVGLNVNLKGNLKNKGSIQVNGSIEGEVRSDENIIIGETANIKGPVIAKIIEVSGEIRGQIEASEKLELQPTAKVFGDINAKNLIIKQGAIFIGKCLMPANGEETAEIKIDSKEDKEDKEDKEIKETKEPEKEDKFGFFSKK